VELGLLKVDELTTTARGPTSPNWDNAIIWSYARPPSSEGTNDTCQPCRGMTGTLGDYDE